MFRIANVWGSGGGGVGELGYWNDCYALLPAFCGSGGWPLLLCVEHAAGFGCGSGDAQAVRTTAGTKGIGKIEDGWLQKPQPVVEISVIFGWGAIKKMETHQVSGFGLV